METDKMTYRDAYYDDGEEEHDVSPIIIISSIVFGFIAFIVLALTAGLYFGLHHFNLGQYRPYLRWLEFIVPVCFLAFCWFVFYGGGAKAEED